MNNRQMPIGLSATCLLAAIVVGPTQGVATGALAEGIAPGGPRQSYSWRSALALGRALAFRQNRSAGTRTGRHRLMVIAVTLLSFFAGAQASAQDAIGAVSRIQGEASGTRGAATRALGLNTSVFLHEVVSTDEAARLEVTFTDNTRLTLGEKAKLTLDTYVFNPTAGSGTIKFGVVGAFRFISGQVSKLASTGVSVTTPVATVGIRGTEFWAGPIDDQALGVFLIEGAVSVSNAAGEQTLNQPGQGTNIPTPGAAPGPVTFWPPDKVNRAIAAVTFQ
jgi:hypothetical protein